MKLKVDRFKDFQDRLKNIPSFYSDLHTLPNPFLRVLKLLEESDRPRAVRSDIGGAGTTTADFMIDTTFGAGPLTFTGGTQLNLTTDATSAVTLT